MRLSHTTVLSSVVGPTLAFLLPLAPLPLLALVLPPLVEPTDGPAAAASAACFRAHFLGAGFRAGPSLPAAASRWSSPSLSLPLGEGGGEGGGDGGGEPGGAGRAAGSLITWLGFRVRG